MNKKDEALKKCLRVLNPIADEKMYETQWIDSAIYACHEALEEKEWQGLTDDEIEFCEIIHAPPVHPDFLEDDDWYEFARAIEQKLKEKNT